MNRQQRRAGGKGGGPGPVPGGRAVPVEEALHAAFQALISGRVAEAETVSRRVLAAQPRHAGALHLLGLVANHVGRLDDAERLIRQAAEFNPKDADARNSLGSILIGRGRFEDAVATFDAALAIRPNFAEALANRGQALQRLGRLDDAIASCRRALTLRPDLIEARKSMGVALAHQSRLAEAIEALNRVVAQRPDDAEALYNLSVALSQAGKAEEAERIARRAVTAAPRDPDNHGALAQALMQSDRSAEALAAVRTALDLDPGSARINGLLGTISLELGQKAEAMAAFDKALERNPDWVPAMAGLVDLVDESRRSPLLERMERALADGRWLSAEDRIALNFALGQDGLRRGDGDRAFAYLGEGNRLKRARIQFKIADEEAAMKTIADRFTPARMAELAGAGARSDRPIFVIGMPRSGTTLVEQILASHPRIWGAGELNTMSRLTGAMPPPGYPAIMETIEPAALTEFGRAYLAQTDALVAGRLRLVDKMPLNFLYAGLIALALPEARIVHCRRDPVDTCLSCYSLLFGSGQGFSYDLAELGGIGGPMIG